MQDPKTSQARTKPWYQRAMEMASPWKTISKSKEVSTSPNNATNLWKTISKSTDISTPNHNSNSNNNSNNRSSQKLRKCTSLKVATSFTRVCLCAPISSYSEVSRADHQINPPRRSNSYPRSRPSLSSSSSSPLTTMTQDNIRVPTARHSMEMRRVFRGKSLTDDVLMRRFVVEEEAMMQVRRRNQMEVIRRRNMMRRMKIGPSPLRRMVLARDDVHEEEV